MALEEQDSDAEEYARIVGSPARHRQNGLQALVSLAQGKITARKIQQNRRVIRGNRVSLGEIVDGFGVRPLLGVDQPEIVVSRQVARPAPERLKELIDSEAGFSLPKVSRPEIVPGGGETGAQLQGLLVVLESEA